MTYWADDIGPTPKALRRLSPLAREQRRDHVLSRSRVLARTLGRQLLALPEQRVEKAHRRRRARSARRRSVARRSGVVGIAAFAEVRTLPAFRTRNWVLHDRPVRTDRLVIALEGSYRRANMVVAQENLERRSPSPRGHGIPPSGAPRDLLVVVDQPKIEQHLANEQDLAAHLGSHGFAVFHAEARSLDDRIRTIRAASCLVLAGAAGVASLVHRIGIPTGVVEILPGDKELPSPTPRGSVGSSACRIARSSGARSHLRETSPSTSPPSCARSTMCAPTSGRRRTERPRDRRLVIARSCVASHRSTSASLGRRRSVASRMTGARRYRHPLRERRRDVVYQRWSKVERVRDGLRERERSACAHLARSD